MAARLLFGYLAQLADEIGEPVQCGIDAGQGEIGLDALQVRYSEKNDRSAVNPDAGRSLDLIQMWVVPDEPEVAPGYEQLELDASDLRGRLAVVCGRGG